MPFNTHFTTLNSIMSSNDQLSKLKPLAERSQVFKAWQLIAPEFLENFASQTRAVEFRSGNLTVACLSVHVSNKVQYQSKEIIEALNTILGKKIVWRLFVEM